LQYNIYTAGFLGASVLFPAVFPGDLGHHIWSLKKHLELGPLVSHSIYIVGEQDEGGCEGGKLRRSRKNLRGGSTSCSGYAVLFKPFVDRDCWAILRVARKYFSRASTFRYRKYSTIVLRKFAKQILPGTTGIVQWSMMGGMFSTK
jgi:hypothetical protein